uniref:HMG1/2-like protein n=1 Tax=Erigeron canadensis TaxID=72917 RepID=UPI001CB8A808|nr:HMG1/2-like protein [Erigeron canadensis]
MKGTKSDKKADTKLSVKKTAKGKTAKDPNKPKRPAGPFFIFMEGFRKQFKEDNPNNKSVAAVGKAGGAAWKAMSDADKQPYVDKAEKRKKDYEKTLASYNKKLVSGGDNDDDSDKSKSEVNDEDDEEGSEEDEDEE